MSVQRRVVAVIPPGRGLNTRHIVEKMQDVVPRGRTELVVESEAPGVAVQARSRREPGEVGAEDRYGDDGRDGQGHPDDRTTYRKCRPPPTLFDRHAESRDGRWAQ